MVLLHSSAAVMGGSLGGSCTRGMAGHEVQTGQEQPTIDYVSRQLSVATGHPSPPLLPWLTSQRQAHLKALPKGALLPPLHKPAHRAFHVGHHRTAWDGTTASSIIVISPITTRAREWRTAALAMCLLRHTLSMYLILSSCALTVPARQRHLAHLRL